MISIPPMGVMWRSMPMSMTPWLISWDAPNPSAKWQRKVGKRHFWCWKWYRLKNGSFDLGRNTPSIWMGFLICLGLSTFSKQSFKKPRGSSFKLWFQMLFHPNWLQFENTLPRWNKKKLISKKKAMNNQRCIQYVLGLPPEIAGLGCRLGPRTSTWCLGKDTTRIGQWSTTTTNNY